MLYTSADEYLNAPQKSIAVFGMSGLGKTYLSTMLMNDGNWFNYNVDYRIGTRYMSEPILDNFKREAMKSRLLKELLLSDSVSIASNITMDNLAPLSTYLGKPGDRNKGGISFSKYVKRQKEHLKAETNAMEDIKYFRKRAKAIYDYDDFIADCSGSLCEIVSEDIKTCKVMTNLSEVALPVWIEGPESHKDELVRRFKKAPKPMYYRPEFLNAKWEEYLEFKKVDANDVDPDDFIVWGYEQLLEDRLPRYRTMAEHWGITVSADEVKATDKPETFNKLIASKLG